MNMLTYVSTILACVALVSSKAIFKVTLLHYEAKEDKCCDGVSFFGTCNDCDPYFTVCLRQPSRLLVLPRGGSFKVTLLHYEAHEDKCCDGVNFFGTCNECDPYFTVCLRQPSRGKENCKDTSRENDKHSLNLAASSIAPTTFNLVVDTLKEPVKIEIKTKDYDAASGDDDMDTLTYSLTPNTTLSHKRVTLQGQNQKYNTKIKAEINVLCENGYHGAGCGRYCVNNTNSYCLDNGIRVCLGGFIGSNCDIKIQPSAQQTQSGGNPDLFNSSALTTKTSVDTTTKPATLTSSVTDTYQNTTDELTTEQSVPFISTTNDNITGETTTDTTIPNNTESRIDITTDADRHSTTADNLDTTVDLQNDTDTTQYSTMESAQSTLLSTIIQLSTEKVGSTADHTTYEQSMSSFTTIQVDNSTLNEVSTSQYSSSWTAVPYTTTSLLPVTSSSPVVSTASYCSGKKLTDGIDASCDEFGWDIKVDLNTLRCLYPDTQASDIYLGKNLCHGDEDGDMVTFNQGLRECLTSEIISGSQLIYNNELIYAVPDPAHPFIIREYNWTVGVECDVYRNESASGHILHDGKGNSTDQLSSQTHYAVDMAFYKDSGYMTEIPGNPLHVRVGTVIYVKVYTPAPGWTIKMVVKNCYTQMSNNATDDSRFYLIQNGCERDANTHIISQSGHELKFVFEDFQYTTGKDGLYLFCDAVFCSDTDTSTRCQQRCEKTRRFTAEEDESGGYDEETVVKQIIHSY